MSVDFGYLRLCDPGAAEQTECVRGSVSGDYTVCCTVAQCCECIVFACVVHWGGLRYVSMHNNVCVGMFSALHFCVVLC